METLDSMLDQFILPAAKPRSPVERTRAELLSGRAPPASQFSDYVAQGALAAPSGPFPRNLGPNLVLDPAAEGQQPQRKSAFFPWSRADAQDAPVRSGKRPSELAGAAGSGSAEAADQRGRLDADRRLAELLDLGFGNELSEESYSALRETSSRPSEAATTEEAVTRRRDQVQVTSFYAPAPSSSAAQAGAAASSASAASSAAAAGRRSTQAAAVPTREQRKSKSKARASVEAPVDLPPPQAQSPPPRRQQGLDAERRLRELLELGFGVEPDEAPPYSIADES
eukprot:Unigene14620_Nuclearia_a/m.44010 Unigene14620_Nuclearia_a/g.44010  ORF Unigene14620_Nuclearia_a/g.44010 Unigene14620_Nuclearia_a/m.44010 type:complete len:283 (+) Unigene14620_Nuclearia_a:912-1760(+)